MVVFGFFYEDLGLSIESAFAVMVAVGVAAGIIDIILFTWIDEPKVAPAQSRPLLATIFEPLRHRNFRRYLTWYCAFQSAMIFGGAFIQLYVLAYLGVKLWVAMLIFMTFGFGGVVSSGFWGRMIDRHGSRPVLIVSTVLKPVSPLVFMLLTKDTAPYVLPVFFLFDSCLNSGWLLATNGYMMRASPRENRGMFTAAMMSLPGICAGVSAIIADLLLHSWEGLSVELAGRTWTNFHLLFLVCAILRALCIPLAIRVREERSNHPIEVLTAIAGILPLRLRALPVKIYRQITTRKKPKGTDSP
jgi:MFS family permease